MMLVERYLLNVYKVTKIGYHSVEASSGLYFFRLCATMIAPTRSFLLLAMGVRHSYISTLRRVASCWR